MNDYALGKRQKVPSLFELLRMMFSFKIHFTVHIFLLEENLQTHLIKMPHTQGYVLVLRFQNQLDSLINI